MSSVSHLTSFEVALHVQYSQFDTTKNLLSFIFGHRCLKTYNNSTFKSLIITKMGTHFNLPDKLSNFWAFKSWSWRDSISSNKVWCRWASSSPWLAASLSISFKRDSTYNNTSTNMGQTGNGKISYSWMYYLTAQFNSM